MSYKNIGIYAIGYITIKKFDDYESINDVNPLYPIIGRADGYIEENDGNKYLVFTPTDGNIIVLTKLWDEMKHLLETINEGKGGEYEKYFMKIKFNSDDNFPFNEMLKLLTVTVRSVFEEDGIHKFF